MALTTDRELERMRNDQAEDLYWRFKLLTDPTQAGARHALGFKAEPYAERDAFKLLVTRALAERDQLMRSIKAEGSL